MISQGLSEDLPLTGSVKGKHEGITQGITRSFERHGSLLTIR